MALPEPEELLRLMSVPSYPGVYVLGCTSRRVTFYAQQCRAFNLVWALFQTGAIKEGDRVAVVGGGLGGMTTAAALALKKCRVTVFEREPKELHLQRQNSTRYIHPRIYDWPDAEATQAETDLPCLNWRAARAEQVVDQVLDQWKRFLDEGVIDPRLGFSVNQIFDQNNKPCLSGNGPGWASMEFERIVLAVGFGKERFINVGGTLSYWQGESLHQRDLGHSGVKRVLVSGCGDGGLIDVLRLSLDDFRHEFLTSDFLPESAVSPVKTRLLEIDSEARALPEKDAGLFIYNQYTQLTLPDGLITCSASRLRTDTKVTLNGAGTSPFSLDASLLNRFCVFLLFQHGLSYQPGKLLVDRVRPLTQGYEVTIEMPNGHLNVANYDELIIRHGPQPVLTDLLQQADANELRTMSLAESDITTIRSWPASFYPESHLCAGPTPESRYGRDVWELIQSSPASATSLTSRPALPSTQQSTASPPAGPGDVQAPVIVFDERAFEYSESIFTALRAFDYERALLLSREAVTWLSSNLDRVQAQAARALNTVLLREALSRAARHRDDPQRFAEIKEEARKLKAMAKGDA